MKKHQVLEFNELLRGRNSGAERTFGYNFPFRSSLSLDPVIRYWREMAEAKSGAKEKLAKEIIALLDAGTDIEGIIEDPAILEQHKDLVEMLMCIVIPPTQMDNTYMAALRPFGKQAFFETERFAELPFFHGEQLSKTVLNMDVETAMYIKVIHAYMIILKKCYGIDLQYEYPIVAKVDNEETGLSSYYKFRFNPEFVCVKNHSNIDVIDDEMREMILANLNNLDVLYELLPPEQFELEGFVVITAVDVTHGEVLSSLKHKLIAEDSLTDGAAFEDLQQHLRTLLSNPRLQLGLTGIRSVDDPLKKMSHKVGKSILFGKGCNACTQEFKASIYGIALEKQGPVMVHDISKLETITGVERYLLGKGIKNILVAPLYFDNELTGIMEVASERLGDVNSMNTINLQELYPLFSMAVKRNLNEIGHQIQAIIKEQCTAVHPSVEWRFEQAAMDFLEKEQNAGEDEMVAMEPIVFEEVYPLFGLSDIRGSSDARNTAIKADLVDELMMVRKILDLAYTEKPLPILQEVVFRIDVLLKRIGEGLGSGDELEIYDFLGSEIAPLLNHISGFGENVRKRVSDYRNVLDQGLGILYRKRKAYEDSVTMINDTVSAYIEREEEKAQDMFPHYFEKYKTDGVDYTMYIGGSMHPEGKFDYMYLKNLRLWQLMLMCGVVRKTEAVKTKLPLKLNTTHLILVQNSPLSIRFRFDEKHFDVDGTYNVRYEIMKKRIDKAIVRGTGERLTQPGKIAIVYSQAKEAAEYKAYLNYLIASGDIESTIEELDIEPLQGVNGLRALRVDVNLGKQGKTCWAPHFVSKEFDEEMKAL